MHRNISKFGVATLVTSIIAAGTAVAFFLVTLAVAIDDDGETVSSTRSNGLGDHIEWHSLDDGLALAKQEQKPLMLIIHKSWCGACKSLKPKFRSSEKIAMLSKNFVMVNTMDDDEPPGDVYRPDGGYVPRLFFFDPEGELLTDVINEEGNPQYKYYYYDALSIATSMEKVAALFPASSKNVNDLSSDDTSSDDSSSDDSQSKSEL